MDSPNIDFAEVRVFSYDDESSINQDILQKIAYSGT